MSNGNGTSNGERFITSSALHSSVIFRDIILKLLTISAYMQQRIKQVQHCTLHDSRLKYAELNNLQSFDSFFILRFAVLLLWLNPISISFFFAIKQLILSFIRHSAYLIEWNEWSKVLKWNVKINHQRVFKMMTNINLWILCILILTRCTFLFSFMRNCLIVHCAPLEIRERRHKLVFPCGMRIIERFKI